MCFRVFVVCVFLCVCCFFDIFVVVCVCVRVCVRVSVRVRVLFLFWCLSCCWGRGDVFVVIFAV